MVKLNKRQKNDLLYSSSLLKYAAINCAINPIAPKPTNMRSLSWGNVAHMGNTDRIIPRNQNRAIRLFIRSGSNIVTNIPRQASVIIHII